MHLLSYEHDVMKLKHCWDRHLLYAFRWIKKGESEKKPFQSAVKLV